MLINTGLESWESVFLRDGVVHKFIDFEQAFLGSREILVGVLLHNPAWPAHRLFSRLRGAGFFEADVSGPSPLFGFRLRLRRRRFNRRDGGKPWGFSRLRTAYRASLLLPNPEHRADCDLVSCPGNTPPFFRRSRRTLFILSALLSLPALQAAACVELVETACRRTCRKLAEVHSPALRMTSEAAGRSPDVHS